MYPDRKYVISEAFPNCEFESVIFGYVVAMLLYEHDMCGR